jgi:hypothetical protein
MHARVRDHPEYYKRPKHIGAVELVDNPIPEEIQELKMIPSPIMQQGCAPCIYIEYDRLANDNLNLIILFAVGFAPITFNRA